MAHNIKIIYDIPTTMRDGITLYGDLYRPDDQKAYPVVLNRTPYDKSNNAAITGYVQSLALVRQGYCVFIQDIRGTHMSQGEYTQVGHEVEDGYDTLVWMVQQDWCDGNIGMMGESAHGYTQLCATRSQLPQLETICPFQTSFTRFPGIYSPGVAHSFMHDLIMRREQKSFLSAPRSTAQGNARQREIARKTQNAVAQHLPLANLTPENFPEHPTLAFRLSMSTNLDNPEYYKQINRADAFEEILVPCLCLTGWYDFLRDETIHNFHQLQTISGSTACRENSRLIIGPWTHGDHMPHIIDGIDFGQRATIKGSNIAQSMKLWFDAHLKREKENDFINSPKVHVFVMGENQWRTIPQWPPDTALSAYYLHSGGRANSLAGDGYLSREKPATEPADSYLFNPMDPIPVSTGDPHHGVIQDQRPNESRDDVLVYTTEAFQQDMELIGELKLVLYAASTAKDTDFVCKISDVHPDGRALNLSMRLIRARFRNGCSGELLEPGSIVAYEFSVGNTGIRLPKGHRLRMDITSSMFPDADPNLNTGEPLGPETHFKKALQTIFHDEQHPSALLLPLCEV